MTGKISEDVDVGTLSGAEMIPVVASGNKRTTPLEIATYLGGATSYTPAWTSTGSAPSLGNGTLTGRYVKIGKLVIFSLNLTIGSTTIVGTGDFRFTVPSAPDVVNANVLIVDASAGDRYLGNALGIGGTSIFAINAPGGAGATYLSGFAPVSLASGDTITITGSYLES